MPVTLHDLAKRALDGAGMRYDEADGFAALRIGATGENGRWIVMTRYDQTHVLRVYSIAPIKVPEDRRAAALELVARINAQLPLGCFELRIDEGEILCRTSIDGEAIEAAGAEKLGEELARGVFLSNLAAMDAYLPAILRVADQGLDPVEALARSEG